MAMIFRAVAATTLATMLGCFAGGDARSSGVINSSEPYLLLVSFYRAEGQIHVLDDSPYDGVAVPVVDAYYSGPSPSFEQVQARFLSLERQTAKQVWPWLFFNRMVGPQAGHAATTKLNTRIINGIDLDGRAGARTAFLNLWRVSLRQAKRSGAPGIVLDMEFYNNPQAYSLEALAQQRSALPSALESQLRRLGSEMATIANVEFPNALVWTLVTGLTENGPPPAEASTRGYVLIGFLDAVRRHHFHLTLLDGGEDSLGYCHDSLSQLAAAIRSRNEESRHYLHAYGQALALAGTIAMWVDSTTRIGWLRQGDCGLSDVNNPRDFQPYLKVLLSNYKYVWIYAPIAGQYDPYNASQTSVLNAVLRQAKATIEAHPRTTTR